MTIERIKHMTEPEFALYLEAATSDEEAINKRPPSYADAVGSDVVRYQIWRATAKPYDLLMSAVEKW